MVWSSRSKSFNLFSRWGILLLSLLAGLLVGLGVALFWPSTYTGTSSFFVSTRSELLTALVPKAPTAEGGAAEVLKPTQDRLSAILGSRLLRARLVQKHRLAELLKLDPAEAETMLARMVQVNAIGQEGFTITVTCRGFSRARTMFAGALGRNDARQLCADLANSYLTELQDYVTTTTYDEARKKRLFLQTALDQAEEKLAAAQTELRRLQSQYTLNEPADKAALLTDRVKTLEGGQAEALATTQQTAASLTKAAARLSKTDALAIAKVVQTRNPVISQLEQKLAQLKVDLATQEAMGKTRQNREVAQTLVAIETTGKEMKQVAQDIRTEFSQQSNPLYDKLMGEVVDLQIALAGSKARAAKTRQMLGVAERELRALPPVVQRYAELKQDEDVQLQTRLTLKQALSVALIQERQSKQAGEFLVLDKATAPPDLYGPPIFLGGLAAAIIVLAVMGLISMNRAIFGP